MLGRLYIAEQRSNLKSAPAAVLELYAALKAQFASAMEYYDSNVRSLVQVRIILFLFVNGLAD